MSCIFWLIPDNEWSLKLKAKDQLRGIYINPHMYNLIYFCKSCSVMYYPKTFIVLSINLFRY